MKAASLTAVILGLLLSAGASVGQLLNDDGMSFFQGLQYEGLHAGNQQEESWRVGRATFYGNEPWAWSIHEGSCGFGYLWEDEPLGWDVAALPDVHYEFAGSCGKCYEVACAGIDFKDNYDNHLDRSSVCYNPDQSVVVRITDTCPCNYVTNAYSNKRWCCGDMDHFDLSVWAFEKLADKKWGVIGLKYRPVPCDYVPANPAPPIAEPFPPEYSRRPSTRPWWLPRAGQSSADALPPGTTPPGSVPSELYDGEIRSPFWEKSWNAQRVYGWAGPSGGEAFCANIAGSGALGFTSPGTLFDNHVSLEMWVRTQEGVPKLRFQLKGTQGECGMVGLNDLQSAGENNGYSRYTIYLGLFDFGAHHARVTAFASDFKGCGGNTAVDIQDLYIRNDQREAQFVCIDNVKLI